MDEYPSQASRFGVGCWILMFLVGTLVFLAIYRRSDEAVPRIASEIDSIKFVLKSYRTEFGAFPTGNSQAICHALTGENLKGRVFIVIGAHGMSPTGDLLDPWGTPYRIYFSGDEVLVRSAGPNKEFEAGFAKNSDDYIQ